MRKLPAQSRDREGADPLLNCQLGSAPLRSRLCAASAVALYLALACFAQPKYEVKARYQKAEYMVAMRDGIRLHTSVYTPRKSSEKLPFLLFRTPYGTGPYGATAY